MNTEILLRLDRHGDRSSRNVTLTSTDVDLNPLKTNEDVNYILHTSQVKVTTVWMELPYVGFSVPKSFGMCDKLLVSLREITCGNIRIIWIMEILSK